jgi:hypothetical protein
MSPHRHGAVSCGMNGRHRGFSETRAARLTQSDCAHYRQTLNNTENMMTPSGADAREPLTARTLHDLSIYFDTQNHHPSPDHWAALGDIASTLEAKADGHAQAGKV